MNELTIKPVDVARLKVEPGEILLVQVEAVIDMETQKRISNAFRMAFAESGGNVPGILVIDGMTSVTVVRAADVEGH